MGIKWEEQSKWKDPRIAFNNIKELIENKQILIFQLTDISIEECRGFSIFESIVPIIAINRKDSYTGRIFSLIHEFIHLCFHQSCITNQNNFDLKFEEADKDEYYINKLTAAVLIPVNYLKLELMNVNNIFSINSIKQLADIFSISRECLVIRLFNLSFLEYNDAETILNQIYKSYKKNKKKGFISPVLDVLSKYGKPITKLMFENYQKGFLHVDEFYTYIGLKEKHIDKLMQNI